MTGQTSLGRDKRDLNEQEHRRFQISCKADGDDLKFVR